MRRAVEEPFNGPCPGTGESGLQKSLIPDSRTSAKLLDGHGVQEYEIGQGNGRQVVAVVSGQVPEALRGIVPKIETRMPPPADRAYRLPRPRACPAEIAA